MSMAIIRRFTSISILLCAITAAWPSRADVCFLPTGECEQAAKSKKTEVKTCDEYKSEGGYYSYEPANMKCTPANISGCSLFSCASLTCDERGFKLESASDGTSLPANYSGDAWNCESCKQGDKTMWKCSPRPCDGGYKTSGECADTETWIAAEGLTHKSGLMSCGMCKTSAEMSCPSGTTENIQSGCMSCEHVYAIAGGIKNCYRCRDMVGYVRESEYSSRYNNSCYEARTKRAADGTICYKPVEVSCGSDRYRREELINGKYVCSCVNNMYEFSADETNIQYPAAGGGEVINILSQRIGEEVEEWPYEMISSSGFCSVKEALNKVIVKCDKNPSEEIQKHTIKLEQTEENGRKNHITIAITVAADECKIGSLESACINNGCDYKENGEESSAGQKCYDCGECRSGVRSAFKSMIKDGFDSFMDLFD